MLSRIFLLVLLLILVSLVNADLPSDGFQPVLSISPNGVIYSGQGNPNNLQYLHGNPQSSPQTVAQPMQTRVDGPVYSEPYYPVNPPSSQTNPEPEPQKQVQPIQEPIYSNPGYSEPYYPSNPQSPQTNPEPEPQKQVQPIQEPVYNNPGYSEPYYPSNPPSPQSNPEPEPQKQVQPIQEPVNNNPGYSEPYYPVNPPSSQPNPEPEPQKQVQPIQEPVNNNPGYSEPYYPVNPPSSQPIQEPVYNNPGYSEPYYPVNPPSPQPNPQPEPQKQVQPIQEPVYNNPGYSEPFYPVNPPSPQPNPQPEVRFPPNPPAYYSSKYYQRPSVIYYSDDDDSSCGYYNNCNPRYNSDYYNSKYYSCGYYNNCNPRYNSDNYNSHYYYCKNDICGGLEVASVPRKAEVYLDNTFRGYTPSSGYLTLYDLSPGTYTLHLKYSGYYDYYEDVLINRGRITTISCNMIRIGDQKTKIGSLYIQSDPEKGETYLDNIYKGITPLTLKGISAGEHTILIRKSGFIDYLTRVTIVEGQEMSISAILPREIQSPVITTLPTENSTPAPTPTKAGLPGWIIIISLSVGGILLLKHGRQR